MKKRVIILCAMLFMVMLIPAAMAGSFQLPDYEKFTLNNGLTVYLMEQHEVPLIYANMVFPAGAVHDGEKSGLATLTADGLLFGTEKYSKKEIEEQLDFIGASFGTSAGKEFASFNLSFLNADQDKVFPIMKDIVINPIFDTEEFAKHKSRVLVNLERAKENPGQVIGSYYYKFLFGDNPYGNPVDGTVSGVTEITDQDLKTFYKAHYTPKGSAIAIVGDFKTGEMKEKITKMFSDWKNPGAGIVTTEPDFMQPTSSRVLLVNKDDATETRFMIGSYGIKRSNPDYIPVLVVNTIFGGRFTSWLMDELRTQRGLTYGAYSRFNCLKNAGLFYMSSFTPTDSTETALRVTLQVLDKLHNTGVDDETLQSAKNYIKGQFPPDYETSGQLAGLLTDMFVYKFDENFINTFEKKVDQMTVERADEIINKYFPKQNLQFVLIGKGDAIRDLVKNYGQVTEKQIQADGF